MLDVQTADELPLRMLTGVFPIIGEQLGNLAANISFWNLDIILGRAIVRHEREEAVVGDIELYTPPLTHRHART